LVLFIHFIAILEVDVAAVHKRHCAAAVSQQRRRLCSVRLKPAMHILNKAFESNIMLLAIFVTAVDSSIKQLWANRTIFFVIFVHFGRRRLPTPIGNGNGIYP